MQCIHRSSRAVDARARRRLASRRLLVSIESELLGSLLDLLGGEGRHVLRDLDVGSVLPESGGEAVEVRASVNVIDTSEIETHMMSISSRVRPRVGRVRLGF
jgi:hypothetical protein